MSRLGGCNKAGSQGRGTHTAQEREKEVPVISDASTISYSRTFLRPQLDSGK